MNYKIFDDKAQSYWNRKMYDDIIRIAVKRLCKINGKEIDLSVCNVLDVGAGSGGLSLALLRFHSVQRITLLDLREEGLKIACDRIHKEHPTIEVECIISDVCEIPKALNCFDLVLSRGSLRFWKKQIHSLMEIRRVMKKGGLFYIGGGRGSRSFQAKREREEEFIQRNENKKSLDILKKLESHTLSDEDYEKIFRQEQDQFQIYHNEGDGHWLVMKKEGLKNDKKI